MRLPDLDIELPEWKESDFIPLKAAEEKIRIIAGGAGKGSDSFKDACRRLLRLAIKGDQEGILKAISTSLDVRAFTFLLATSEEFCKKVSLNRHLIQHLTEPRQPMSKLSLLQLISSYFVRYDTVADQKTLLAWQDFIKEQLSATLEGSGANDLATYGNQAKILFSPTGPANVVGYAKAQNIDFDVAASQLGLTSLGQGRFMNLCRYLYYLDTLRTIDVGEDHDILQEVVKKEVVNAPVSEKQLLGHAVLEILIDRTEGQPLSEAWQSAILTIAGDPRVPHSSAKYQKWWTVLGDKRIALMRGWLSRFDLALFLRVLEQSAMDSQNYDMERMFGPRKVFMEGLLEQGVVQESRLFLTASAESYLTRNYKRDELPSYARVTGGQASVIYLRLKNELHIVEGTHSFSIRVMNKLPGRSGIENYAKRSFNSRDLGAGLGEAYIAEFKRDGGLLETMHHPQLTWQNKVIGHLAKHKLTLDIGSLIPESQYREYKYKFGVN